MPLTLKIFVSVITTCLIFSKIAKISALEKKRFEIFEFYLSKMKINVNKLDTILKVMLVPVPRTSKTFIIFSRYHDVGI